MQNSVQSRTIPAREDKNSIAASDAFSFADGVKQLIKAGVKIIVQPGGSIHPEVIKEANKGKIKMIFSE